MGRGEIPQAFTELQAACLQCLPAEPGARVAPALLADRRGMLSLAVIAADQAGGSAWPEAAAELLARARGALREAVPTIPRGTFRDACAVAWPAAPLPEPRRPSAWRLRADIGDPELREGV